MYDFHKLKGTEYANCFSHPSFQRGARNLISEMKRKVCAPEPESAHHNHEGKKKVKQGDLISTITELSQRLIQLETRNKDYDDLLRNYREVSEKNQRLEHMLLTFTQTINNSGMGNNGTPIYNRDTPRNQIDAPPPQLSPSMYRDGPSAGPSMHGLFNDILYPFGRFPGGRMPTISRNSVRPGERPMIEAPQANAKSPYEESKEHVQYQQNGFRRVNKSPRSGMDQEEIDIIGRPQPGMSPKLSDRYAQMPMYSPGLSPPRMGLSPTPYNPSELQGDRVPSYLNKIELSPLRQMPQPSPLNMTPPIQHPNTPTRHVMPSNIQERKIPRIDTPLGEEQIDKSTACNDQRTPGQFGHTPAQDSFAKREQYR